MDEVNAVLRGNGTQGRATSSMMHIFFTTCSGLDISRAISSVNTFQNLYPLSE